MQFRDIIGNPPYQQKDGGGGKGTSAVPLYPEIIEGVYDKGEKQIYIIPCRWMTGGKGLEEFRGRILQDTHRKRIEVWEDSQQVFKKIRIGGGVCILQMCSEYSEQVETVLHEGGTDMEWKAPFRTKGLEVYVRDKEISRIYEKVREYQDRYKEGSMSEIVSPRNPYGIKEQEIKGVGGIRLLSTANMVRKWKQIEEQEIGKKTGLNSYKVFVAKAQGSGRLGERLSEIVIGKPQEVCTESFLQIGVTEEREIAEREVKYIKTKFFRAMLGVMKNTQNMTKNTFRCVPKQDFQETEIEWGASIREIDEQLYKKYGLTEQERGYIENKVQSME